jgi:tetratricopeptide (TPR) repeat protein
LPLSIKDLLKRESKNKTPGESTRQLVSFLNQELVTGKATTGTHAMLAEHYLGEKSFTQAIVHLEQVFRIAPTAAKYSNDLAELYISAGRLDDALNVANRSLSILSKRELLAEKHVDDLLENLGYIYQKLQNWEEAVPALELCLSFSPERPQARYRLAEAYRKTGKQELAEEQEKLAAATELTANRRKTLIQKLSSTESLTTMFREMGNQTGSNDRPEIQPLDFNRSNPESPKPAE